MAQFDHEHVIVYQAYREEIARFAITYGYFGGDYNLQRMSWIKPGFLWMMHRSGWGQKQDQEIVLAIWIRRPAFDYVLEQAVHSSFIPEIYGTQERWKELIHSASARLQWDPDYDPADKPTKRRAIQLGLRDALLTNYAQGGWISRIKDMTEFVRAQHQHIKSGDYLQLEIPCEKVYPVTNIELIKRLQLSPVT